MIFPSERHYNGNILGGQHKYMWSATVIYVHKCCIHLICLNYVEINVNLSYYIDVFVIHPIVEEIRKSALQQNAVIVKGKYLPLSDK